MTFNRHSHCVSEVDFLTATAQVADVAGLANTELTTSVDVTSRDRVRFDSSSV